MRAYDEDAFWDTVARLCLYGRQSAADVLALRLRDFTMLIRGLNREIKAAQARRKAAKTG